MTFNHSRRQGPWLQQATGSESERAGNEGGKLQRGGVRALSTTRLNSFLPDFCDSCCSLNHELKRRFAASLFQLVLCPWKSHLSLKRLTNALETSPDWTEQIAEWTKEDFGFAGSPQL